MHGRQRIASDPEEVVIDADLLDLQHRPQHPEDTGIAFVAGTLDRNRGLHHRGAQAIPVDLPVPGARQVVEDDGRARLHVLRQRTAEMLGQPLGGEPVIRHHVEHDALVDSGRAVPHRRQPAGDRFDLAELYAVAIDLDLAIVASQEDDVAVTAVHGPVAGAVQPLPGARMRDERVSRLGRVVPVARRQATTGDVKISGHQVRTVIQTGVEDVHPLVGQGPAVGNTGAAGIIRGDLVPVRPDRCLGGATGPVHGTVAEALLHAHRDVHGDPIPAEQHRPDAAVDRPPSGQVLYVLYVL